MVRFDQASLSPVAVAPRESPLPFGLSWPTLRSAMPGFDQSLGDPRMLVTHEKQGLHQGANSMIATIEYPTSVSACTSRTVFIKRSPKGDHEAGKYELLARHGLATPAVLVATRRTDGYDVFVLDFVPTIGIDFLSRGEVTALLLLIASMNAIKITRRSDRLLLGRRGGRPSDDFDRHVLAALGVLSTLGLNLLPPGDVDSWFAAYRAASHHAAQMQRAVNHGEMYFQQVGWLDIEVDRHLVPLDVATLSLWPRFMDIANILPALVAFCGLNEQVLVTEYLQLLDIRTGISSEPAAAYDELRHLRIVSACATLPWLVVAYTQPEVGVGQLRLLVQTLRDDLVALGLVVKL